MIPLMIVIRIRKQKRNILRLWVPLFLVWLLLLPFILLSLPLVVVVLMALRMNPFRALKAGWQLMAGLRGTQVEVDDGSAWVLVRIF
jgi:hypothetical protein